MTGCTTPEPRGTTASGAEDRASVEEGTSADGPTITQSPWHLVVLYDSASGASDPLNEVDVTARFSDDGRVTGRSGCHRYTANYEVSGDSLAIGPAATPPPDVSAASDGGRGCAACNDRVSGDTPALSASPNGRDLLWGAAADTSGAAADGV